MNWLIKRLRMPIKTIWLYDINSSYFQPFQRFCYSLLPECFKNRTIKLWSILYYLFHLLKNSILVTTFCDGLILVSIHECNFSPMESMSLDSRGFNPWSKLKDELEMVLLRRCPLWDGGISSPLSYFLHISIDRSKRHCGKSATL